MELTNSTVKNSKNIYKNGNTAEYISGHGFEPFADPFLSARLNRFQGKTSAADPEHRDSCQKGAERNNIDRYGLLDTLKKFTVAVF